MQAPFVNERASLRSHLLSRFGEMFAARACLAMVVVFGVVHFMVTSSGDPAQVLARFWLGGEGAGTHEVWRWLSHAFVHGNGWHLAINAAALWLIGSRVERIQGPAGVLKVFFSGVLAGAAMQLLAAPPSQNGLPLVGASGGIFTLLLWLTTVSPELRTWPLRLSGRNLGRGIVLAELLLLAAGWWLPRQEFDSVAHGCHLGGALAGWLLGKRVFRRLPTLEDLKKERARRESADGP